MKISKETFNIIRNFSGINQSIVLKPGNVIRTAVLGDVKDFYATANIKETIPVECAIYDLKKFRDCANLFSEPDFEFDTNFMTISDGKNNLKYVYCSQSIIDAPDYNKNISIKNPIVSFPLKYSEIKLAIDASNILGIRDILISSECGTITMIAFDEQNRSSDTFCVTIATETDCVDFTSKYSIEKMRKLIDGEYTVTIADKVISEFKTTDVVYHIGGEIIVK